MASAIAKYPFWVVKRGEYYAKNALSGNYMTTMAEFGPDVLEAAHFGRDMAKRVANYHKARVVKITGAKPPKRHVHLALVLDNSSSMAAVAVQAKRAFDELLGFTRTTAKDTGVDTVVSVWTCGAANAGFNNPGYLSREVKELMFGVDIGNAHLLNYSPNGSTPLFDAIGNAIARIKESPSKPNTSYLVQVITDGEENNSCKYAARDVNLMIASAQAEGNWTFVFHMPPGKRATFVNQYGVPMDNCREWERTAEGLRSLEVATSASTQQYYGAVTRGVKATKGFFVTDLSKVKSSDVKRNLVDVSSALRTLTVPKEYAIKDFVEEVAKQPYRVGDAFYMLTKDEKLASHKKLLVREKGTNKVYFGDDARAILGIPAASAFSDLRIRPGNHGNWDIFCQSTSTNRKLVRGTNVLLLKAGETL